MNHVLTRGHPRNLSATLWMSEAVRLQWALQERGVETGTEYPLPFFFKDLSVFECVCSCRCLWRLEKVFIA